MASMAKFMFTNAYHTEYFPVIREYCDDDKPYAKLFDALIANKTKELANVPREQLEANLSSAHALYDLVRLDASKDVQEVMDDGKDSLLEQIRAEGLDFEGLKGVVM